MARRFREVLAALLEGLSRTPREADIQIARRAASLILWSEAAEARQAAGHSIDIGEFTTAANTLRRLLAALGVTGDMKGDGLTPEDFDPSKFVIEYVDPDNFEQMEQLRAEGKIP